MPLMFERFAGKVERAQPNPFKIADSFRDGRHLQKILSY